MEAKRKGLADSSENCKYRRDHPERICHVRKMARSRTLRNKKIFKEQIQQEESEIWGRNEQM